jgi:hypothetical protein
MNHFDGALARFIRSFEHNSASGDVPAVVQQFAEVFLVVTPDSVQCIRSVDFAVAVPKRKQLFDRLGRQSSELIRFKEIRLDLRYALARTRWRFIFRSVAGEPETVEVDVTYLIHTATEPFKILLYLAHQNIMEILTQRGLMGDA